MKSNRMKDALENIARRSIPENTNLWPAISARLERKPPMMSLRYRPLSLLLIALLILILLSSVAYALGRMLGYVPGIGLIEQGTSMRAIESSISAERAGIRLTVLDVIAGPTNTLVRFQVEWLSQTSDTGDFDTGCQGTPSLQLSDGTSLRFVETKEKFMVGEPGINSGYGYVMEFEPIPADQNDMVFLYPCLTPLFPGPLPRDWQIPFHLIPAPDGLVLPVNIVTVEISPTVLATEVTSPPVLTQPAVDFTHRIFPSIDSFVDNGDGYLLIGSLQWSVSDYPAYSVNPVPYMGYISVVDANGQEVFWEEVFGNAIPRDQEFRSYWGIKILSKTFTPPLTITLNAADVKILPVPFSFDVGATPQVDQSWEVNRDIQIADSPARVLKATLVSYDGNLNFQLDVDVDENVIGDLYIDTPLTQCMGGGGGYPTERLSTLQVYVPMCRPELPPGVIEMQVTGAVLWGQWQVDWQP